MSSIFDAFTHVEVGSLIDVTDDFDVIELFLAGNHYQNGAGFIGPLSSESDVDEFTGRTINAGIAKAFTSEGVINEVVDRRIDGVLSKMPGWSVVPRRFHGVLSQDDPDHTDAEQRRIDEQTRAQRNWVRTHGIYNAMHDFARSITAHQRCLLRLYIPIDRVDARTGRLKQRIDNASDALRNIFVEVVLPDTGIVYTHQRSMYDLGVVSASVERADAETDTNRTETLYEVSYLDPDTSGRVDPTTEERFPLTVVRHLSALQSTEQERKVVYDLRGALLHHQGEERRRFVSQQMIEAQRALNTASTELRIVNDDEGFQYRILFNTLPPGRIEIDEDTGEKRFVPSDNFELRAGSLGIFQGIEVPDPDTGKVRDIKTPSAATFPAGNPLNYEKEIRIRRRSILNEASQLFVEIMDDATSSGDSRVQALFDFLLDIAYLKRELDKAGSWLFETSWALALHLSGSSGRDHDLRTEFDVKLNVPYLPSPLIDAFLKLVDAGARSLETLMQDTGIDDVAAERRRIEQSDAFKLRQFKQLFELTKLMVDTGVSIDAALEVLQQRFPWLTSDDLDLLARADTIPPDDETVPAIPSTNGTLTRAREEEEAIAPADERVAAESA